MVNKDLKGEGDVTTQHAPLFGIDQSGKPDGRLIGCACGWRDCLPLNGSVDYEEALAWHAALACLARQ
jgi:hypothetical protein